MTEKMTKVGIDKIGFYIPNYYLDLKELAAARGIDADKFYIGLGQKKMAIAPPGEDIVTMAANATTQILKPEDKEKVDTVLFATETGFDYSKAAGMYVHKLLQLPHRCRVLEVKQACYSSTGALQIAMAMLQADPKRKILLIASDIAKYGFATPGESSQGAGAVALLLAANPKIAVIDPVSGFYAKDTMDFWRPHYMDEAIVDGKYSCSLYLQVLQHCWQEYKKLNKLDLSDLAQVCYHVSVPKLVAKAHKLLKGDQDLIPVLKYNENIGNCYTASLYISLISLLENSELDLVGKRVGMYSYGSGCVGEFFSIVMEPKYTDYLHKTYHKNLMQNRTELNYDEYRDFYNFKLPINGQELTVPKYNLGKYRLAAVKDHKRIYETVND